MVLTASPDYPRILVRTEPGGDDDAIIGWAANPGSLVQVREYNGNVYGSDSSVGNLNGRGLWGKADSIKVYFEKDGKIQKKTVRDRFVSFNFLTPASESRKSDFYQSSE